MQAKESWLTVHWNISFIDLVKRAEKSLAPDSVKRFDFFNDINIFGIASQHDVTIRPRQEIWQHIDSSGMTSCLERRSHSSALILSACNKCCSLRSSQTVKPRIVPSSQGLFNRSAWRFCCKAMIFGPILCPFSRGQTRLDCVCTRWAGIEALQVASRKTLQRGI